ncbi:hypothetical protein DFJ77DRAFT_444297 [Powellomyces hirtus]|nr:hypothetical protein DFJ77DRAFT_444300 [Powellomyces hirtus]KAI8903074.1 hypothetical protein DFJ77DRAFT_444299 [Powellomyces hirtus]KAI8903078.1 hypothetical protein DFJ77DRAFT_444297 [Powellomyces hirtus]
MGKVLLSSLRDSWPSVFQTLVHRTWARLPAVGYAEGPSGPRRWSKRAPAYSRTEPADKRRVNPTRKLFKGVGWQASLPAKSGLAWLALVSALLLSASAARTTNFIGVGFQPTNRHAWILIHQDDGSGS